MAETIQWKRSRYFGLQAKACIIEPVPKFPTVNIRTVGDQENPLTLKRTVNESGWFHFTNDISLRGCTNRLRKSSPVDSIP